MKRLCFLLCLELAGAFCCLSSSSEGWSVDLRNYGFQQWRESSGLWDSSTLALATTHNLIAIALGNPSNIAQADVRGDPENSTWQISLLVFDPHAGRLRTKSG